MKTAYNILYIRWKDASSTVSSDWKPMEVYEDLELMEIHSVGFMIEETDEHIILVSNVNDQETSGFGDVCIPKSSVIEMTVLVEETDAG